MIRLDYLRWHKVNNCVKRVVKCSASFNSKSRLQNSEKAMAHAHEDALKRLKEIQSQPLSIIRLSEPNSASIGSKRSSDISSTSVLDNGSPASLAADLSHYKELFSKLRFSYLEQITKEKFLRAIVGDPPLIVENAENLELELQLKDIKTVLREQKEQVAITVEELERRGRELSTRYETVGLQTTLLDRLPGDIEGLNAKIESLRRQNQELVGSGEGLLPLDQTLALTSKKERELEMLEHKLKSLRQQVPGQAKDLDQLQKELKALEKDKEMAVRGAKEAVKTRQDGGESGDALEMKGRWLKGSEDALRRLLGVEA